MKYGTLITYQEDDLFVSGFFPFEAETEEDKDNYLKAFITPWIIHESSSPDEEYCVLFKWNEDAGTYVPDGYRAISQWDEYYDLGKTLERSKKFSIEILSKMFPNKKAEWDDDEKGINLSEGDVKKVVGIDLTKPEIKGDENKNKAYNDNIWIWNVGFFEDGEEIESNRREEGIDLSKSIEENIKELDDLEQRIVMFFV